MLGKGFVFLCAMLCLVTQYFVNKRPDMQLFTRMQSQALHAIPGAERLRGEREQQVRRRSDGTGERPSVSSSPLLLSSSHVRRPSPRSSTTFFPSLAADPRPSSSGEQSDYAKTVRAGIICVYAPRALPALPLSQAQA